MLNRAPRSGLRAIAPFAVAGTLALTASVATGFEPGSPSSIPDGAFHRVILPSPASGETGTGTGRTFAPGPTPDDRVFLEPAFATPPPERAQPSLGAPDPVIVAVPTPTPKPQPASDGGGGGGGSGGDSGSTSSAIRGYASWYCRAGVSICTASYPDTSGFDAYAAAGPRLRAALGDWRGRIVYVDGIRVKLIDWCQCYRGEPNEKLLDLYYDVFQRTGTSVTVRW